MFVINVSKLVYACTSSNGFLLCRNFAIIITIIVSRIRGPVERKKEKEKENKKKIQGKILLPEV